MEDEDVLKTAVEGTKNVMRAAKEMGVKKVVLTSCMFAVFNQFKEDVEGRVFTAKDWNEDDEFTTVNMKAKIRAETLAWEEAKGETSLTVLNPGYLLGPMITERECST